MKKFFFLIVLILGTSIMSYAGETVVTPMPVQNSNTTTESVVKANNTDNAPNTDFSQTNAKKKKKKKLKTWQYIVGGVLIVVIVVLSIIAPNGFNSRTGI